MVIYGGRRSASIDSADHHLHPHTQSTKTTLTFHKTNMIHQLFWESLTKLFRKSPLLCDKLSTTISSSTSSADDNSAQKSPSAPHKNPHPRLSINEC